MITTFKHYQSGHEITCKKGFSWTTLFFGLFVPLFRGDIKWFAIMFIVHILGLLPSSLTGGIGTIIICIIFACIYNGRYINDLGKKGYLEKEGQ